MIVRCELIHDFNTHTCSSCRRWGQEDVENYSKKEGGDVSHNAHPEAWILQECFIEVGEKHITNGHACYPTGNMSHKRDLTKKPNMNNHSSKLTRLLSYSKLFHGMVTRYSGINTCLIWFTILLWSHLYASLVSNESSVNSKSNICSN